VSGNGGYPLEAVPLGNSQGERRKTFFFLATPHEVSREWGFPEAVAQGVHVIDLSGAWAAGDAGISRDL